MNEIKESKLSKELDELVKLKIKAKEILEKIEIKDKEKKDVKILQNIKKLIPEYYDIIEEIIVYPSKVFEKKYVIKYSNIIFKLSRISKRLNYKNEEINKLTY